MTIGNAHDAALAAFGMLPYLGEGEFRTVYKSGDVVYKVENYSAHQCNLDEHVELLRLSSITLPHGLAIPDFTLHNDVLAMTFIDGIQMGECYCTSDEECDIACLPNSVLEDIHFVEIFDVSYGNVILSNGLYYLVDVAY